MSMQASRTDRTTRRTCRQRCWGRCLCSWWTVPAASRSSSSSRPARRCWCSGERPQLRDRRDVREARARAVRWPAHHSFRTDRHCRRLRRHVRAHGTTPLTCCRRAHAAAPRRSEDLQGYPDAAWAAMRREIAARAVTSILQRDHTARAALISSGGMMGVLKLLEDEVGWLMRLPPAFEWGVDARMQAPSGLNQAASCGAALAPSPRQVAGTCKPSLPPSLPPYLLPSLHPSLPPELPQSLHPALFAVPRLRARAVLHGLAAGRHGARP